ncbi:MAG: restriction endonuclease [Oceanospirillaceae bacterium]|nr:restriction endonuclease [Oceanospirillaceae bacterium]|tara:strand:+ start:1905 stop:3842 length:1938 start_codon:yes stop_codon:yes gene_type:complete
MTQHNKPDDNQIQEVAEAYFKKPETGKSEFSDATRARDNAGEAIQDRTTEGNATPSVPSVSREIQNRHSREAGAASTRRSREGGNPLKIVEHLDLWTSTVTPKSTSGRGSNSKIELTGIKKLRELILELAVRGKLVVQNPDDEPASKLLERIEAEKAQLIKDGKLKKQKPLAPVSDEEKPFELPEGWEWVRLGDLFNIVYGKGLPTSKLTGEGYDVFGANGLIGKYHTYTYEEPQLLVSCRGAYSGKANISPPFCLVTSNSLVLENSWELINQRFFYYQLLSGDKSAIVTGSAQPQVTTANLSPYPSALPPIAEQQRIVAKVDELMALCDQLEQQSEHQISAHQQLTDTLLATLTESANVQELNDNWQRLTNHFDLLFSGAMGTWAIDRLKDTILQLAVMGKLVPQNPDDEPASELLERIEEEKARLIKEDKIKKPKKLPPVSDEEKPFELPEGWEWCRLPEIGELARGKSKHRPRNDPNLYKEGKYPLIQTGDVARSNGSISTYGATYNDFGLQQSRLWPAHTLCITIAANIADTGLLEFDACFPDSVVGFNGFLGVSNRFYEFFVRTYKEKLAEFAPSTAQKNINLEILSSMLIPVSPLPEQQRIVAKVDELFALCDQLKYRLQQASETEQQLTNAIVEQALG